MGKGKDDYYVNEQIQQTVQHKIIEVPDNRSSAEKVLDKAEEYLGAEVLVLLIIVGFVVARRKFMREWFGQKAEQVRHHVHNVTKPKGKKR